MARRIIPRSEWGARHEDGWHDRKLPARLLGLHHSVTIAPDLVQPFDDDFDAVRKLEEIGENRFGKGISYTWPITPAGLIFEGHSPGRSGAHTLDLNDVASAICWVGDYSKNKPSEELILATAWLVVHVWRQGWVDEPRIDAGHGGLPGQATECPGQHARAAIARVNELAALYAAGAIDLEDDDMPSHITLYDGKQVSFNDWARHVYGAAGDLHDVFMFPVLDSASGAYKLSGRDLLRYIDHNGLKLDQVLRLLAAFAEDKNVTPEELERIATAAATESGRQVGEVVAQRVNSTIAGLVELALEKVQGADNEQEITELLRRIGSLVPQPQPEVTG